MKGPSAEFESVKLHLNGHFAPVAETDGSFALAFPRSAILNEHAHIRIPLVLVGKVETNPIGEIVEPVEINPVDTANDLTRLFS